MAFLTIGEAASMLRVGRTKAYAMAKEWRETGGRRGLPVVDFGDVLRVPLHALEKLVDDALAASPTAPATAPPDEPPALDPTPMPSKPSRSRRHRPGPSDQTALFDLPPAS